MDHKDFIELGASSGNGRRCSQEGTPSIDSSTLVISGEALFSQEGDYSMVAEMVNGAVPGDDLDNGLISLDFKGQSSSPADGFGEVTFEGVAIVSSRSRSCEMKSSDGNKEGSNSAQDFTGFRIWTQVLGATAGALVQFGMATTLGLSGVVLPALVDTSSDDLILDPTQAALFSSLFNIGAMVGSLASGPLMVWLGQRVTLLVVLPVAAAGWFLQAFAPAIWVMQFSRVLLGVITGISGGPALNYVSEISHSSVRGRLSGLTDLFRQCGFLFVYVVGSMIGWRYTSMICGCITTIVPFALLMFLPNSPRWLASKLRNEEAHRALLFFRGSNYLAEKELKDIIKEGLTSSGKSDSLKKQFRAMQDPSIFKRLVLLLFIFVAYQFSGNTTMIAFSTTIFQTVQSETDSYYSTIIVGFVRVFAVMVYMLVADKLGRRPLLLTSLFLASVFMASLTMFSFASIHGMEVSSLDWVPLVSLCCFVFFTCCAQSNLNLYRSELLPISVRSVGVSIIYIFFFTAGFLVSFFFPMMLDSIGSPGTFLTYSVTGLVLTMVVAMFIPETKSRSLEDIEKHYRQGNNGAANDVHVNRSGFIKVDRMNNGISSPY